MESSTKDFEDTVLDVMTKGLEALNTETDPERRKAILEGIAGMAKLLKSMGWTE